MYTFCPECGTVFQVKAGHLNVAGGMVRCGECRHIFSAVDYLHEDLADARDALAAYSAMRTAAAGEDAQDDFASPGAATPPERVAAQPVMQPVFSTEWSSRPVSWKDISSGAGIGLLILLLGIQWVYFNRAALSADANWRPTMERFCSILHCDLPLQTDLARIELLNRDVRKHPREKSALLVNATLVNHAGFTQPYPVLSLGFSALSGAPLAVRRFEPAEYLDEGIDIEAGMAPDTPVQVVLEIEDPGEEAVSYEFNFL
jgi:predicted Zn finger-like uncharacterized protein